MEFVFVFGLVGAAAGAVVAGVWWSLSTLLPITAPTEVQFVACALLGAVLLPAFISLAVMMEEKRK